MAAGLEVRMPANHDLHKKTPSFVTLRRMQLKAQRPNLAKCPATPADDLWSAKDLYTDSSLCPICVITNHYEARYRRLANRMADDD
jgi:hypothetical protein